jgi:hypothetical protein
MSRQFNPSLQDFHELVLNAITAFDEIGLDKVSQFVSILPKYMEFAGSSSRDAEALITSLANQVKAEQSTIKNGMELLGFIGLSVLADLPINDLLMEIKESIDETDSSQADQAQLEAIFSEAVPRIIERRPEMQRSAARKEARRGVLPAFDDISSTVEMRAAYISTTEEMEKPEDNFVGYVGIASVRLDLDIGTPDFVAFQVTTDDLTFLIKHLSEIRNRLLALELREGKKL